MKPIKMFGLAVMASLMAMAFVGASSAMAETTALCTADETPCAAGNLVGHVHENAVIKATLLNEIANVKCNVLYLGDTLGLAISEIIHGTFTYSGCNSFCTVTEQNGPGLTIVLKTAAELAKVTYEFLINVNCPFLKCNFTGESLQGHGLGPLTSGRANGSIVINAQTMPKDSTQPVGFICPSGLVTLDIETEPLVATYISS